MRKKAAYKVANNVENLDRSIVPNTVPIRRIIPPDMKLPPWCVAVSTGFGYCDVYR